MLCFLLYHGDLFWNLSLDYIMCENVDSREAAFELAILVSFYKSTVGVLLYFFYYFEMGECPMFLKWE